MHVIAADLAAADALAALERECLASPWSAQQLAGELGSAGALGLLATDADGEPMGYALFRSVLDEAELLRVAVRPGFRRRGVARDLLLRGETLLRDRGCARLFLEVAEHNAPAIALYERLGWTRSGRRPGYYADGSAALLFHREVAGPAPDGSPGVDRRA